MASLPKENEELSEIDAQTRDYALSLSEKDRRLFVALQAKRAGHGGIAWICSVVGCSRHTVERGMKELGHLAEDPAAGRVRRPGAGRKKKLNPDRQPKVI